MSQLRGTTPLAATKTPRPWIDIRLYDEKTVCAGVVVIAVVAAVVLRKKKA